MMNEALPMLRAETAIAAARLEAAAKSPSLAAGNALLYLDGVTVSFDGFKALNELSLVVEKGELRTIIGPNGAGKTTMMDVVTGKTRPEGGQGFFACHTDPSKLDEAALPHPRL